MARRRSNSSSWGTWRRLRRTSATNSRASTFLAQIPWTRNLRRVPDIAYAHHEKLDGAGYPRQLTADQIPVQSRMMTIADIYDALTASDRPYKKAVPHAKALDILGYEAKLKKLDQKLLDLFIEAKVYEALPMATPA